MKTIKRSPIRVILTEQQKQWIDSDCCAICGIPRKDWKRKTDWKCCSKECTKRYDENIVFIWQSFRLKVFYRDNYNCKKCGFESRQERMIHPDNKEYYDRNYKIFKILSEDKDVIKVIIGDASKLIADHIKPIAVGGEEYNLDNCQTLCIKCNKEKTKKDLKEIAVFRKQHPKQKFLEDKK